MLAKINISTGFILNFRHISQVKYTIDGKFGGMIRKKFACVAIIFLGLGLFHGQIIPLH